MSRPRRPPAPAVAALALTLLLPALAGCPGEGTGPSVPDAPPAAGPDAPLGGWPDAVIPPADAPGAPADGCPADQVGVAARADDDVRDYDRLLELATTLDWPAAEVVALEATGCADLAVDADALEKVRLALEGTGLIDWNVTYVEAGGFTTGGAAFLAALDGTFQLVEERVGDGLWDPDSTSEGAALYARRYELVARLRGDIASASASYREVTLRIEAEECSETAVAVVDVRTGAILVVHEYPGC